MSTLRRQKSLMEKPRSYDLGGDDNAPKISYAALAKLQGTDGRKKPSPMEGIPDRTKGRPRPLSSIIDSGVVRALERAELERAENPNSAAVLVPKSFKGKGSTEGWSRVDSGNKPTAEGWSKPRPKSMVGSRPNSLGSKERPRSFGNSSRSFAPFGPSSKQMNMHQTSPTESGPGPATVTKSPSTKRKHAVDQLQFSHSEDNIASFLKKTRLHKYTPKFEEKNITFLEFLNISTHEELEALGVTAKGARNRMLQSIERYNEQAQNDAIVEANETDSSPPTSASTIGSPNTPNQLPSNFQLPPGLEQQRHDIFDNIEDYYKNTAPISLFPAQTTNAPRRRSSFTYGNNAFLSYMKSFNQLQDTNTTVPAVDLNYNMQVNMEHAGLQMMNGLLEDEIYEAERVDDFFSKSYDEATVQFNPAPIQAPKEPARRRSSWSASVGNVTNHLFSFQQINQGQLASRSGDLKSATSITSSSSNDSLTPTFLGERKNSVTLSAPRRDSFMMRRDSFLRRDYIRRESILRESLLNVFKKEMEEKTSNSRPSSWGNAAIVN